MTPFVCLVNNLQPVIPIDILQLFKIGRREACSFYQDSTTLFMGFVCFLCNQFLRNLLPIPHWIRQHCWQLEPFVQTQRHMCIRRVKTHRHNINANECQYKFSCGFLQVINFCNAFFFFINFLTNFSALHFVIFSEKYTTFLVWFVVANSDCPITFGITIVSLQPSNRQSMNTSYSQNQIYGQIDRLQPFASCFNLYQCLVAWRNL